MYQLKANHMKNSITLESPWQIVTEDRKGRGGSSRESKTALGGNEGSGKEDRSVAV